MTDTDAGDHPRNRHAASARAALIAALGTEVVRFQEESIAFDDAAAQVLALPRRDLSCMTLLLFGGPATVDRLALSLHVRRSDVLATVDRLERAGYARRRRERRTTVVELTEHAREWIERIWAPLREDGVRLLSHYAVRDLALLQAFMARARTAQGRRLRALRRWLDLPGTPVRRSHLRGGLTPAAMRRIHVWVEAHLEAPIRLQDMAARAGLSLHHFARAFRTSAGTTPRAFVEGRRIERARQLIEESDRPLAEIALATGLGTQSRLTTIFRRRTGFTPGEYRRTSRQ